jgi:Tol biopolymer transport system component
MARARTTPTGDAIAYSAALNVDGEFALGGLHVADLDGSAARRVADAPSGFARWSPDGSRLTYERDGISVLDVESGMLRHYLSGRVARVGRRPHVDGRGGGRMSVRRSLWISRLREG